MDKERFSYKKILILVLFFMMLSPTLSTILGAGRILPIDENRRRASLPSVPELKQEFLATKNIYPAIERWYNDNFGLRDLLIRLQHQIDYSLFGFNVDLYFMGDKYMAYRSVVAVDQIDNEEMKPEELDELISGWEHVGEVLDSKGIDFRFFLAPQKNEVLLEEAKQLPIIRPEPNAYLRLEERLKSSRIRESYVSVLDALKKQNQALPVYYRSDFHWNDWGAAVGFAEVFNSYGEEKGLGPLYSLDNLSTYELKDFHGGQSNNLSLLLPEDYEEYTVSNEAAASLPYVEREDGLVYWDNSTSYQVDGAVLFVGDSYTLPAVYDLNGTKCGFVNIFEETYFCHWDQSKGLLNRLPDNVRLIIFEKTESGIPYLSQAAKELIETSSQ